jgi:hypothetical protein
LRAIGSRERAPDDRLREAMQSGEHLADLFTERLENIGKAVNDLVEYFSKAALTSCPIWNLEP